MATAARCDTTAEGLLDLNKTVLDSSVLSLPAVTDPFLCLHQHTIFLHILYKSLIIPSHLTSHNSPHLYFSVFYVSLPGAIGK
ncbi:hypothetical protein SK128_022446 [Halocaridina rubra]|uniref:Uncharacterized protein n=1 Tax=Halocaridina rubra TaxID=373956 RepID=A0AAN8WSJ6_HALRR